MLKSKAFNKRRPESDLMMGNSGPLMNDAQFNFLFSHAYFSTIP
jgi:hypothetical protein